MVLNPRRGIDGLADSKVLSPRRREELAGRIRAEALAWAVEAADVDEIDSLNILWATMAAMKRAVDRLGMVPDEVLVDGNRLPPELAVPARAIVRGDATVPAISAASILAKVARDAHMIALHEAFPHYGFDRHKGYPTAEHFAALERHGPCPHHRRTFSPVRACEADDEPGRAARPDFF